MKSGFYVYRFLNEDNIVLYVGRTHNLKNRFKQHVHLTDQVKKIEYIVCRTEIDMIIKELYYINMFNNKLSTNIKDVYDEKPTDFHFNDNWNVYIEKTQKEKELNLKNIYLISIEYRCNVYDHVLEEKKYYYTGKCDKNGFPEKTTDQSKAKRYTYSSLNKLKKLVRKFQKMYNEEILNYELQHAGTSTCDTYYVSIDIYMSDITSEYLFRYYNGENTTKTKLMNVTYDYLDICQYSYSKHSLKWNKIEKEKNKLKESPEWEERVRIEEFTPFCIKHNGNLDDAMNELLECRKSANYVIPKESDIFTFNVALALFEF